MTSIKITVGPDTQCPGVGYNINLNHHDECDSFDSGGWNGTGPRRETTDAWFALWKRRNRLPYPVREAGLAWADAEVQPFGWSQGAGHAPQGITITWSWGQDSN